MDKGEDIKETYAPPAGEGEEDPESMVPAGSEEPEFALGGDKEQVEDNQLLDESFELVVNTSSLFTRDAPAVASFKDHFTLLIPSSTVRYRERHSAARVLEGQNSQFVLEELYDAETKKHNIEIRKIHNTSEGVRFLRISYALVAAFFTGFLFVFCLQVLLFLVLDLALQSGATTHQTANWGKALGAILAFPVLVYGFASALVLAGSYIADTYRGHYLIRNFTFRKVDAVLVEWMFFSFFLGFPVLVMSFALLSGTDNWWEITLLFWFGCVLTFYVIFAAQVVKYELRACWSVIMKHSNDDNDGFFHVLARCITLRQTATYSGMKIVHYLARGTIEDSEYTDKKVSDSTAEEDDNIIPESRQERITRAGKLTLWKKLSTDGGWGFYESLEGKQQQVFTIDDTRDVRPYLTSHTWSLEKVFCRPKNSRYIAIVKGPGALTRSQMRSSVICSFVGTFLIFFLFLSALWYLQLGIVFTMFIVAIAVIVAIPTLSSTYRLYHLGRGLVKFKILGTGEEEQEEQNGADAQEEDYEDKPSEAVYLVELKYRISRPTMLFCWLMFILEVGIFFVYPFLSLFLVENYPLAIIFIVVGGISATRYYINVSVVLEETGNLNLLGGGTEKQAWARQSRLNEIVGNITRGRSLGAWMAVLGSMGFIVVGIFLGALGTGTTEDDATFDVPYNYVYDFEYKQVDSLRYPTCTLTAGANSDGPLNTMADFAFLAGLAYRGVDVTQSELDSWFGEGVAIDEPDVVSDWKSENVESEVSFKFITFPNANNFGIVTVRGTSNQWDMLTDAQLWNAAFLMQGLRVLLPLGKMWTPAIDQLINIMTTLETESIERVSFYKDVTQFIKSLQKQIPSTYSGLGVTGHSLGGGLAIISGAQTGIPAVALSGPNAMLSRLTFDPPVTAEALDKYTFNIIPERDVVPMIDIPAQNWQSIRCTTDQTDVVGCHDSTRSLCEILDKCGSGSRPVLCECVTVYGYPEPMPKNDTVSMTFSEACGS